MFFNQSNTANSSAWATALKNNEAVVIDVRTRGEFMGGNVADSVNIPLDEILNNVEKIKKMNKTVILCCASGNRSGQATRFLTEQGVKNLYNGGAWKDVNYFKNK